jgi:PII-like signaling protein
LTTYGPTRYSAIAGDGGPNVRSAKIKINAEFPWILNIYDPCHNLNLFLKDLGKLFKDVCSFVELINIFNTFLDARYRRGYC